MTVFGTATGVEGGSLKVETNFTVDLNQVPSSDPLAFMFGANGGAGERKRLLQEHGKSWYEWRGQYNHGCNWRELAPEYIRGFLFGFMGILVPEGTKIRKGEEQTWFHSDKNMLGK